MVIVMTGLMAQGHAVLDFPFAFLGLRSLPPVGGRGAVKLAPLRRRRRGERAALNEAALRRRSRGERWGWGESTVWALQRPSPPPLSSPSQGEGKD